MISRMFGWFRRRGASPATAHESSAKDHEVLHRMLRETQAKAGTGGGDPFAEYRRTRRLPEVYEYGMNCLFDCCLQLGGIEITQATYECLRDMPEAYTIRTDTDGYNIPGIPILFTVNLAPFNDAQARAATLLRLRRDPEAVIREFVYHEPQPERVIPMAEAFRVGRDMMAKLGIHMTIFAAKVDRIKNCQALLGSSLMYKSRTGSYWHSVVPTEITEAWVCGHEGRRVFLSYCSDESGELLVLTTQDVRDRHFPGAHELGADELRGRALVYSYKPYEETIESLLRDPKIADI